MSMRANLDSLVSQWTAAGVVDEDTAARIRAFERNRERSQGFRWPILIALAFGAILLGAGVLLFVSAHWDRLPPGGRLAVVIAFVSVFHVAGAALASRFHALSVALHTTGTVALGGGIALAGQIYHLSAHWPAAVLMWAVGAAAAWVLLRHWTHAAIFAILAPYWLAGEWWVRAGSGYQNRFSLVCAGFCALSLAYLAARRGQGDSTLRKALGWIGAIAILPTAAGIYVDLMRPNETTHAVAWLVIAFGSVAVAALLRGFDAVWNVAATAWVMLLLALCYARVEGPGLYGWYALGALGLAAWGIREGRAERINLGTAGFALTVLAFYFSSVLDKLGRSASLIGLGLLFLGGGWLLERTRRKLIASIRTEVA
jgi:uncharacterized membrane protein